MFIIPDNQELRSDWDVHVSDFAKAMYVSFKSNYISYFGEE